MTKNQHRVNLERLPLGNPHDWRLTFSSPKPNNFMAIIDDLKALIPSYDREYVPAIRSWLFSDAYFHSVVALLSRYGIETNIVKHTDLVRSDALAEMFLTPNAPDFVIVAVFKALAKRYHPDAGGSTEQMQKLNRLMEVVR